MTERPEFSDWYFVGMPTKNRTIYLRGTAFYPFYDPNDEDYIAPSGIIIFLHDHTFHPREYTSWFSLWENENIIITPNLPGHGLSGGLRGSMSVDDDVIAIEETIVPQLERILDQGLRIDPKSLPIYIIGHGFGALVAYRWAQTDSNKFFSKYNVKNLVCINPTFRLSPLALERFNGVDYYNIGPLLPLVDFAASSFLLPILSIQPPFDPALVTESYQQFVDRKKDLMVPTSTPVRDFFNIVKNQYLALHQPMYTPLTIIQGTDDPIPDLDTTRCMANNLISGKTTPEAALLRYKESGLYLEIEAKHFFTI